MKKKRNKTNCINKTDNNINEKLPNDVKHKVHFKDFEENERDLYKPLLKKTIAIM